MLFLSSNGVKFTPIFKKHEGMKIAFIGLGIMGQRMAANLLKNGVDLTIFNRSKEPVFKLEKLGAKAAPSIEIAVEDADIVFSMLSNPDVVKLYFFGEYGGLSQMKEDSTWVDCSTVNPSFSMAAKNEAEKRGVQFMDAPVAGTKPQAENAELVFFVGGSEKQLERLRPFFEMMGQKIMHIGEQGKGASYKMLVNILLAESMVIFSEALLLGQRMGLDKKFLLETIPNLPVTAPFTKFKAGMIWEDNYEVNFPLELMHKDLHLAAVTAYELNQPLHMANLTKEIYAEANKQGLGRHDFAAIYRYLDER